MSYDRQAELAIRLIQKNGAKTTLRRPSVTVGDEKSGTVTVGTPATYDATVVVLPYQAPKADSVEAATLILSKVRKVLISPDLAVVPAQNDELFWDSKWWQIDGVAPLNPDGARNVLFTAIAKIP